MPIINQVVAGGGTTPTGTITITSNGTHDVTNYATADVQVPTTGPALYREFQLDANGVLQPNTTTTHIMDFTGVADLSEYILYKAYNGNTAISGTVDLSKLTTITGPYCMVSCFEGCPNITGVDMSNVVTISGVHANDNAFKDSGVTQVLVSKLTTVGSYGLYLTFKNCLGLSGTIDFSKVESVGGDGMEGVLLGCSNVTGVNVNNLTTVSSRALQSAFAGTGVSSVAFPSLIKTAGGHCFNSFVSNTSVASLWFYAYNTGSNNDFSNMLRDTTNVVVHFPMNMQATMSSWANVTSGFNGTNTTVLFDIVTTLTGADTNTYTRSEKNSTSTATAWLYNDTLYYTSGVSDNTNGVNEPAVSDAIYSDAACTQSVTTITAIA